MGLLRQAGNLFPLDIRTQGTRRHHSVDVEQPAGKEHTTPELRDMVLDPNQLGKLLLLEVWEEGLRLCLPSFHPQEAEEAEEATGGASGVAWQEAPS